VSSRLDQTDRHGGGDGYGDRTSEDQDDKSPVSGDPHAGICGSRGCDSPRPPDT
jgi:hypothetical protein